MYRRGFLLGLASLGFSITPSASLGSQRGGTVFNIVWRDIDVGYSSINLVKNDSQIIVKVDVKIDVALLGIRFFSYSLECEEIWKNKNIWACNSTPFLRI